MSLMRLAKMMGLAVLAAALPAAALTVSHELAGLSLDVPDNWSAAEELDEDGVLTVSAPGDAIVLKIWPVEEADLEAALEGAFASLEEQFEEIEVDGDVTELEINGLPALSVAGTGIGEDGALKFVTAVVMADMPVVFVGFGDPELVAEHHTELQEMYASIRPIEG